MTRHDMDIALAKHDLESALRNLEKCDLHDPNLGEAYGSTELALKFVNEELEIRRKRIERQKCQETDW